MIKIDNNNLFHVHTYRCGHAENITDEKYIIQSISKNYKDIWFSDHAPFPGDPFGGRMKYNELNEYLKTLSYLKEKYKEKINVHIGLEIEYFPTYDKNGYYEELKENKDIEFLLLGQHMAEDNDIYTFSWNNERLNEEEYQYLGNAIISGIKTGYFDFVAHPDRIFRRCIEWNKEMEEISLKIIESSLKNNIPLEKNILSMSTKNNYRKEFWEIVEEYCAKTIIGYDAHYLDEIL